jgi:hypothetical protein
MTEESLFDAIADLLPAEQREPYYRRMAHLRKLSPNDEILHVCEAMGFLALITRETPEKIAEQRTEIERIFAQSVLAIQAAQQSTFEFYQKMESRIVDLPAEIQSGIDAEDIARRISESIRQKFNATGLPTTASSLQSIAASLQSSMTEFVKVAGAIGDHKNGPVARVNSSLQDLETRLAATMGRLNTQLSRLQWRMLTGVAILCGGCLVVGILLGALFAGSSK